MNNNESLTKSSKKFRGHCHAKFKLNKHYIRTLMSKLILLVLEIKAAVMLQPRIQLKPLRIIKSNYNSSDSLRLNKSKSKRSWLWYRPKASKWLLKLLSLSMTTKRSKGSVEDSAPREKKCENGYLILRKSWKSKDPPPRWQCLTQELAYRALQEKHQHSLQAATGNNRRPWYLSQATPLLVKRCQNRSMQANRHQ